MKGEGPEPWTRDPKARADVRADVPTPVTRPRDDRPHRDDRARAPTAPTPNARDWDTKDWDARG
ncbi:hypothetical protein GS4_41_00020 [Gordonia soli NBRC 108243]|uniref:Uncharacterized protein n=1 Tax=Gordonia soli NBRC 108243 TaxID=1223545 RepID=M0QR48_9ACTN|nr:hypothetical protein GS4_41_00020 [Gordonia soli NBRC 108243]